MSDTDLQQYNSSVKSFEQRVINRSVSFLFIFDKLADRVLECFTADTNPGTLSLLSFLPLAILAVFHPGPTILGFGFTALVLLIHQIMDIANKKQAYRLYKFSLATFYIDHIYDSMSCPLIVYIITSLMEFQETSKWLCIFLFGFLPFYLAHVSMYYTGYMQFQVISPSTEGLLFVEILCMICLAKTDLLQLNLFQTISIYQILFIGSCLWLITFLLKNILDIRQSNKDTGEMPLKNLFIILALGYIFLQTTIIANQLLENKLFFGFISLLNVTHFSILIGNLVMSYGSSTKFNQLSINSLVVTGGIVTLYSVCHIGGFEQKNDYLVGVVSIGCLAVLQTGYFLSQHGNNLKNINQALSS